MNMPTGEQWTTIYSTVGEALDHSINRGGTDEIIRVAVAALDEAEALLMLARHAEDYERTEMACRSLAAHLAAETGHDEELVNDILRELSGLAAQHRLAQHMRRIEATRAEVFRLKQSTMDWFAEKEREAEARLEQSLMDAGFIAG